VIVLGVDPGLRVAGYSVMSLYQRRYSVVTYGAVRLAQRATVSHRVGRFYEYMREVIIAYHVSAISLETPFLGKNAQNFLKLGYVRGVLYLLAYQHNLELYEFSPREVKQAVTGFGGARKEQVSRMVHWMCPHLADTSSHDVTDALAVAMCGCLRYM